MKINIPITPDFYRYQLRSELDMFINLFFSFRETVYKKIRNLIDLNVTIVTILQFIL